MIEYTLGRGQATLYKWKQEPKNNHVLASELDKDSLGGGWEIQDNIPNFPQTLARISSKNTLFDPNFNFMLSIDNI